MGLAENNEFKRIHNQEVGSALKIGAIDTSRSASLSSLCLIALARSRNPFWNDFFDFLLRFDFFLSAGASKFHGMHCARFAN